MKKLILTLISVWLFTAGCVYYPYPDAAYYDNTDSGYSSPDGYYYPYYAYPYYYYPYYYYPGWGYRYHYGPYRRW
jgi:hypothetical protein